jgi:hypothetical protein
LPVLTTAEGWHENDHRYPGPASQGFFWWEVDVTYYGLRLLARLGLVWGLRRAPESVRAETMATCAPRDTIVPGRQALTENLCQNSLACDSAPPQQDSLAVRASSSP